MAFSMDDIRERDAKILRLFQDGYTVSAVAAAANVSRLTVEGVVRRELQKVLA